LKQYIIANRLKPGDRLPPEEDLVEQLGVSRSALREALRSMEALGIIAAQHGVGRIVLPFSFEPLLKNLSYGLLFHNQSLLQVTEIRKALDAYFIESTIRNVDETVLSTLSTLVDRMKAHAEAGEDFEQEDYEFHRLLFTCCGNDLAIELFEITWQARSAAISRSLVVQELPPGTHQEHRDLLDAIAARDVERARRIIVAHHWNIEYRFRQAIEMEIEKHADGAGDV
jgi:DNA-binding FadR family transcriptional regulator